MRQEIEQKIKVLEQQREQLITSANKALARVEGQIEILKELLEPKEEPAPEADAPEAE